MKFLVKTGKMTLLCIYQHPLPLKNTTPLLLIKSPPFKSGNRPSPLFRPSPLYIGFLWTPPPTPVKLGFFREPQKYKGFSSFSPSYLLKITKFLVKISEFPWKKSPLLSQQPSSKSWGPVKLPFFEKLVVVSTSPQQKEREGGLHTMNAFEQDRAKLKRETSTIQVQVI